jgi:hypothetical protein
VFTREVGEGSGVVGFPAALSISKGSQSESIDFAWMHLVRGTFFFFFSLPC